jgi:hypothetical protein
MFVIPSAEVNQQGYITILKNLLSVKLLSCKTQGHPYINLIFVLGRLSLCWKPWPTFQAILVPKLKQLEEFITNNRGSQHFTGVKLATFCYLLVVKFCTLAYALGSIT